MIGHHRIFVDLGMGIMVWDFPDRPIHDLSNLGQGRGARADDIRPYRECTVPK